ncbi:MAG: MGMT family protein [Defluviitaleaceae bacterium]|nr:MGMT family protein [Defluviitaleaceae bacterium]MCL2275594.1 MGMT family protein [Defluviitaleaceae bacterium]
MSNPFYTAIYELVAQIPNGRVTSYGAIARALGHPRSARTVGWAMAHCPEGLPWQRVVMADGAIAAGEYAALRRAILEDEGVSFLPDGRVDMKKAGWTP